MNKAGLNIAAIVTKPSVESDEQPVAVWAQSKKIKLFEPKSPKEPEFISQIRRINPDMIAVAGYHRIIPKDIIEISRYGTINVHAGLLPQYRGPCCWKWNIINGEETTGVTVHEMITAVDSGDILSQQEFPIDEEDTGGSLFIKFSKYGALLLLETIEKILNDTVVKRPQDERNVTYFSSPTEQDARINWN